MRVIAGLSRGRKLLVAGHGGTRPTPARVREALFSSLMPYLPGARVLDLFSGSGALGIEAMSRGAAQLTLVERDAQAAAAVRQNVRVLPDAQQAACTLLQEDVFSALPALGARGQKFDLVLMDAPFAHNALPAALAALCQQALLAEDGRIVVEHAKKQAVPEAPLGLMLARTRAYGEVALATYLRYTPPLAQGSG